MLNSFHERHKRINVKVTMRNSNNGPCTQETKEDKKQTSDDTRYQDHIWLESNARCRSPNPKNKRSEIRKNIDR